MLPSAVYAGGLTLAGHWDRATVVLMLSCCTLLLPSLWSRTTGALFLSLAPIALLSPYVAGYSLIYHSPFTGGLLEAIVHTDMRVELEELRRFALPFILGSVGFILYVITAMRLRTLPFTHRKPAMAAGLWAAVFTLYTPYAAAFLWVKYDISVQDELATQTYPQSVIYAVIEWARSENDLRTDDRIDLKAKFGHGGANDGGVYVFVIGETQRESTWSELERAGYFKAKNTVRFHDVLAQANWTRLAVPLMTRGVDRQEDVGDRPSITDWQRWSGCKTAALSNNAAYAFSRGADITTILGDDDVMRHNRYDHELLPLLKILLDKTSGALCVTLHMVGAHQDYEERFDDRFKKFFPAAKSEQEIETAAYRNAIVMSQDFIASTIELLTNEKRPVFLMFASDHGENLFEFPGLREHVTETPSVYELQVPALFWANDRFILGHPDSWRQLSENAAHPYSTGNLLPTMLDAMGIVAEARKHYEFLPSMMEPYVARERWYYSPDMERHPVSHMLRARE